jgi:hypothetical protein
MQVLQRDRFGVEVKDVSVGYRIEILFLFFLEVLGFGVGCALLELLVVFSDLLDQLLWGFLLL